jgi:long-subunit fatty acid transport protein
MKKILTLGVLLFAFAFMAGNLYAYNYSHDTSFARMMARAATTDAPDAVYYNPVGLVKMADGMYIDLGNQMGAKRYMHKFLFANYHDATPSLIMPNIALVWKKDKAAIFAELHVPAGGGSILYRQWSGISTLMLQEGLSALPLTPNKLKASSFWLQGALGGSFAFTEWLAITGMVKYSKYSYEMSVGYMGLGTISKTKTDAGGFSGAGGIMITPVKMVNITALYSTEVIARGTTRDMKTHYSHIDEARLPDYLLIGVNVRPLEALSIQVQYQLIFSQQKDFGTPYTGISPASRNFAYAGSGLIVSSLMSTAVNGGNSQDYKYRISHKVGVGGEYLVHKMVMVSLGVSYESQDVYPRAQNPFDPSLKNIGVGLGLKINATDNFSIQIGGAKYSYFTDHALLGLMKLNKSVWQGAIGLTAKVM